MKVTNYKVSVGKLICTDFLSVVGHPFWILQFIRMFNTTVLKSMNLVNRFPSSRNVFTRFYSGQRKRMQEFTVLEQPAPGNPFHLAIPVHDMVAAREVNKVAVSQRFL